MGSLFDVRWPFGGRDRRPSKPQPQPRNPPPPPVGLGTHSLEEPDLAQLRQLGVTRLRYTLYWHLWDGDEAYQVHTLERIRVACDMGFKLLVVVHGTPHDLGPEDACIQYPALMGSLAAVFPKVEAWQLLNEQPLYPGQNGARWAAVHHQAYQAIKNHAPQAKVVSLGFSMEQLQEPFGRAFLAALPGMDALGLHVYGFRTAARMRESLAIATTKAGKPVWVTEYGLSRDMLPVHLRDRWEDHQKAELSEATLAATAAQRVYIYQYMTDEVGTHGTVEHHGIVRPGYTHRPAALWLRGHLQTHG